MLVTRAAINAGLARCIYKDSFLLSGRTDAEFPADVGCCSATVHLVQSPHDWGSLRRTCTYTVLSLHVTLRRRTRRTNGTEIGDPYSITVIDSFHDHLVVIMIQFEVRKQLVLTTAWFTTNSTHFETICGVVFR
jgi:hypothetical protein